jgi:hypothetical protein
MAMGMYADNTVLDLTADVTWTSTNTTVASVSSGPASPGLVTALAPGTTSITATFDGMSGTTPLTVTIAPPLAELTNVQVATNKRHMVTRITLDWSAPLNASEAGSVSFFHLAMPGKKGSFAARNTKTIRVKSATWIPGSNEVVLTPAKPFALSKPVQLKVSGQGAAGLEDSQGRLIDGERDGQPGGDAIVILDRKVLKK